MQIVVIFLLNLNILVLINNEGIEINAGEWGAEGSDLGDKKHSCF